MNEELPFLQCTILITNISEINIHVSIQEACAAENRIKCLGLQLDLTT